MRYSRRRGELGNENAQKESYPPELLTKRVRMLERKLAKEQKELARVRATKAKNAVERAEMEDFFLQCIEVRDTSESSPVYFGTLAVKVKCPTRRKTHTPPGSRRLACCHVYTPQDVRRNIEQRKRQGRALHARTAGPTSRNCRSGLLPRESSSKAGGPPSSAPEAVPFNTALEVSYCLRSIHCHFTTESPPLFFLLGSLRNWELKQVDLHNFNGIHTWIIGVYISIRRRSNNLGLCRTGIVPDWFQFSYIDPN